MSTEKHLAKIKKLLNLARSPNSHEAASALSRAQALMRKYELGLDDIVLSDIGSTSSHIQGVRPPGWVIHLVNVIEQAFGVSSLIGRQVRYHVSRDAGTIEFVGRTPNDEIASYCFDVLYGQLIKDRKVFISKLHKNCKRSTKRNRADWYCLGWVSEVRSKVQKLTITPDDRSAIDRWVNNQYGKLGKYSPRESVDDKGAGQAFTQGRKDGSGVSLHAPVNGRSQARLT